MEAKERKNDYICEECGYKLPKNGEMYPLGHKIGYARNDDGTLIGNDGYIIGTTSSD